MSARTVFSLDVEMPENVLKKNMPFGNIGDTPTLKTEEGSRFSPGVPRFQPGG
jgi:hypothetical protein